MVAISVENQQKSCVECLFEVLSGRNVFPVFETLLPNRVPHQTKQNSNLRFCRKVTFKDPICKLCFSAATILDAWTLKSPVDLTS